ncbi:MAG: chromosome segregation protein SMC [Thermoplasmatales archaeon]
MFLKRIEMENFKSFGKRTVIEFKPGYTSVTGPNASGKSNIGDALLFVLGTKSNKSIRAQKLIDLIHKNPSGRPSPFLKASVTFDNTDRMIPIDSNEVTFTRVVKLSENNDQEFSSYYYINDDKARLQDFEYLLEKVKIFADGYNFVRQGDITNIVEMTPTERRGILEEVGGISQYNEEIEKANKEKEKTSENMVTVQALLTELSGRVSLLKHEKELAEAYISKKKNVERDQTILLIRKKRETEKEIEAIKEQMDKINLDMKYLDDEIKQLASRGDELDRKIAEINGNEEGLEELNRIKNDLDSKKIEFARHEMGRDGLEEKITSLKRDISDLLSRKKKLEEEERKNEDEVKRLLSTVEKEEDEAKELELTILDMENKSSSSLEKFDSLVKASKELSEKKEKLLEKISEINSMISSSGTRNSGLIEEISRIEEEISNLEFSVKDLEWRTKNLRKGEPEVENLNKSYIQTKKKIEELREEEERLTSEIEKVEGELGKMQGVKLSGIWDSINFISSEASKGNLEGIKGTVDSLISYDPEFDKAVRAAGGNRLFSIVVSDDENAQIAIELLKKNGKGRLTFLPLNKIIPVRPRGKAVMLSQDGSTLGFLADKIRSDPALRDVISYVFSDTLVVKDLNVARSVMGGVRLVTLDGDIIDPSNAMTGGLLPKREINRDIEGLSSKLSSLKEKRKEVRQDLAKLDKELRGIAEELNRINVQAGKSQGELEQILARKKEMEDEIKKKKIFLDERKRILRTSQDELERAKADLTEMESEVRKISEEISKNELEKEKTLDKKTREEIRALKVKLEEVKRKLEEDKIRLSDLRTNAIVLKSNIGSVQENIEKKQESLSDTKVKLEESISLINRTKVEIDAILSIYKSKEEKLKERGAEIEKLTGERYKINSGLESKGAIKKAKSDFLISLQTKMEDAFSRMEEISREIEEKNAENTDDQRTYDEIKKEISTLEAELKQMEPVNLKSISDYEAESARLEELTSKKSKLEAEMKNLADLEGKLEEQKKVVFLQVFEAVNRNFTQVYGELTNGNEGYLELENVTNPFQGGLIIKASSRAKKADNLASLSGGEKSIAALSFIIAIQNYEPSPIYFMDEVDMFLDGVNAENVGSLFRKNSENAQIIAVTLRKATMKYAHQIIGVTFQDKNSTVIVKDLEGGVAAT